MSALSSVGEQIAAKRKTLGLSQAELARRARIGHSTLDALENGRLGELGFAKIARLVSALGMELKIEDATARRPTMEDLLKEAHDDQGLDRKR
jgi:transcriptional regulator with XRE-family HTH domain